MIRPLKQAADDLAELALADAAGRGPWETESRLDCRVDVQVDVEVGACAEERAEAQRGGSKPPPLFLLSQTSVSR